MDKVKQGRRNGYQNGSNSLKESKGEEGTNVARSSSPAEKGTGRRLGGRY
jgi:hypothetical protein